MLKEENVLRLILQELSVEDSGWAVHVGHISVALVKHQDQVLTEGRVYLNFQF